MIPLPLLPIAASQPPQPLEQPQKADDEKEHWQPHLSNWVEALSWQLSIRLAEGVG